VNATNKYGDTPLHKAAWRNALSVAKFLVQHGADPSRELLNHDNKSPVELARTQDMKRIVAPLPKVEEADHDFEQEDEDSD
jgi:ankyrin repeat protein